jgi:hypothetical protein
MATQNDLIKRVNGWLHSIGSDGRYNRDRLFEQLGSGFALSHKLPPHR